MNARKHIEDALALLQAERTELRTEQHGHESAASEFERAAEKLTDQIEKLIEVHNELTTQTQPNNYVGK